ncbi:hypothetical protein Tco_0797689 [Tanacetum coccineum]
MENANPSSTLGPFPQEPLDTTHAKFTARINKLLTMRQTIDSLLFKTISEMTNQSSDSEIFYPKERIKELELRTQRRNNFEKELFRNSFPTEKELAYHKELSSKSVVIQDTPSAPKSKPATSKSKLKGAPSLTQEEKEVVDIMQDLKESKKSSKRQPGPRGSNKGTGSKSGVPNESTVVSATSSEGTGIKPGKYSDDENDDNDDVEKDDKDGDADDEGDDHFHQRPTAKGVGLHVADSHTSNHPEEMDFRSFMLEGVDGLTFEGSKVSARASKVAGEASTPLDVDSDPDIHEFPSAKELRDATDCHWVVAHVTHPSWKQHLREISIEHLCDIHDRAYMRQAVLDNVLNSRTRELISALYKAKTSYDAIRARDLDKDRAYAELERKCNEALQDLDKNPLVSDMHAEIKEIDSLKQDRAVVVSKVIRGAAMKLVYSDDLGVLIAKLVKSSIIYGRCQAFEEVAAEEPFILEKMSGYQPSSKEEYDRAGDALENTSYPFLAEYVVNPYASLE